MATPQKGVDIEAMFRSLQEQMQKNNEPVQKNNEELKKNREEVKAEFNNLKEQLTTKLEETNTKIEVLQARVEQSLNEQALKMENRFKEQKTEWSKELKDRVKQLAEHWNEKFIASKQEQDVRRKTVSEQIWENINKTQELKARTTTLETAVVESAKSNKDYSGEMNTLKKDLCGEVERLRTEIKRRPAQMMMLSLIHI